MGVGIAADSPGLGVAVSTPSLGVISGVGVTDGGDGDDVPLHPDVSSVQSRRAREGAGCKPFGVAGFPDRHEIAILDADVQKSVAADVLFAGAETRVLVDEVPVVTGLAAVDDAVTAILNPPLSPPPPQAATTSAIARIPYNGNVRRPIRVVPFR